MASPDPEPYLEEIISTLAMGLIATWTVSEGARRSLLTKELLRETGETQPVISQCSALMLPVISSATLMLLYFLFSYIQNFLVLYMVVASFGATSMCLFEPLSVLQPRLAERLNLPRLCSLTRTGAGTASSVIAGALVVTWILTSHWLVLDILGVCITVSVISLVRLPSLKVATIVLVALFFYDIFWVFFSARFFGANVMVTVATQKADNPAQVRLFALRALHLGNGCLIFSPCP